MIGAGALWLYEIMPGFLSFFSFFSRYDMSIRWATDGTGWSGTVRDGLGPFNNRQELDTKAKKIMGG